MHILNNSDHITWLLFIVTEYKIRNLTCAIKLKSLKLIMNNADNSFLLILSNRNDILKSIINHLY